MRITRGDTKNLAFTRKDGNGAVIESIPDEVWFTVKENCTTEKKLIQKTFTSEDITIDENYQYHFTIAHEDTKDLDYGEYVYDIQIKSGNYIKTIAKDELIIESEVTFDE